MVDSSKGDVLVGELGHNEHPLEKNRQQHIPHNSDRGQTERQTGRLTVSIVPRKLPVALMSARLCRNLSMSEEVCSQ